MLSGPAHLSSLWELVVSRDTFETPIATLQNTNHHLEESNLRTLTLVTGEIIGC